MKNKKLLPIICLAIAILCLILNFPESRWVALVSTLVAIALLYLEYNKHVPKSEAGGVVGIQPTLPEALLTYDQIVTMLKGYDNERLEQLKGVLGFEDTRMVTFDFAEMKNYLTYVEQLAQEKDIQLKGISFIKGVYGNNIHNSDFIGYENLIYTPTTLIKGEEVLVDVVNSKRGNIVKFIDMLKEHGYEWRYNSVENFKLQGSLPRDKNQEQNVAAKMITNSSRSSHGSGSGNLGTYTPPYPKQ